MTKNIDEFVLEDIQMLHYEVMTMDHVWLGITLNNGKYYHLNIHGRNIRTYFTDETMD
jgi:hypothetical protein